MPGHRDDTTLGGPQGEVPGTRLSAVLGIRSDQPTERARSLEVLIASYWKPVYKVIRARWRKSNEDAKDLTQEFFARALEHGTFRAYDPAKARFRTFLMICLQGFLSHAHEAAHAVKRGGRTAIQSLDFDGAEGELAHLDPAAPDTTEQYFEREWMRHLFGTAVEALRVECAARGREIAFRLFERFDLEESASPPPTYESLAAEFGLARAQVANHLVWARRRLREQVLESLRAITATEEEFREEARAVLGPEASV